MALNIRVAKWIIWSLAVLFFFYEFLVRVIPSVLVEQLMLSFAISAKTVGLISGFYFYAYAPMQIVVGVLFDRFGARKILKYAATVCGLGVIIFGLARAVWVAEAGRFFMGFGSAFAFVGMIYISSYWFRGSKLALLVGIANSLGMIGGIVGEGPISFAESIFGWRETVVGLGVCGLILALAFHLAIRREPPNLKTHTRTVSSFSRAIKSLLVVIKRWQTWINGIIAFCFYATTSGFAGLWGVPFLMETHQIDRNQAGFANTMIYVGWLFGGPLVGWLSDRFNRRKPFLCLSAILACVTLSIVVYIPYLHEWVLFALLFVVGFFSAAQILNFTFAIEQHAQEATGSSIAFTNFMVTLGGAILQPLVGYLLDLFWTGTVVGGIRQYSFTDYQLAVSVFPLTFLLAFVFSLFLKERYKPKN